MKLIMLFFMAMLATPALGLTSDEVDTIRFTFFKAIRSDKIGAATIVRLSKFNLTKNQASFSTSHLNLRFP